MSAILVIEDRHDFAENVSEKLRDEGYIVESVIGNDPGTLYDKIRFIHFDKTKMKARGIEKWSAIILDINLPLDAWGGVFLFNKLVRDYRDAWEHTIIFSLYAPSDSNGNSILRSKREIDGASFILRVFVDTANIDPDSVLSNKIGGLRPLRERLRQLGVSP